MVNAAAAVPAFFRNKRLPDFFIWLRFDSKISKKRDDWCTLFIFNS